MALGPLAAIDRATLAYLALALGFTLARGPRTLPLAVLLPCALVLTAFVAAVLAPCARRSGPLGRLLAEIYPLLLTPALYTQVGLVNAAHGVGHDALVQQWEQALFGSQVSLAWIRAFPSPSWSTLMHAAYLSFYPILAAAPLGLWFSGRRGASRGAVLAMMSTFYACYAAFLCFPVAGPRFSFALATNAATVVPLAVFSHRFLELGSAWGTAFPSSHVAAALVAAVCAWRGWRPLGAVLLVAASLLTLATVYCQFHYAIDAVGGAVVAVLVLSVLRGHSADGPALGKREPAPAFGVILKHMACERVPAIKVLLLPKDTNALGTIFGGVILSNIDLASAVEARKTAPLRFVTKAMRAVEFHEPVFLGDIVSFYTETVRVGRSSLTVRVSVEAERWGKGHGEHVQVTEAEVVLVAVDETGRPRPIEDDADAVAASRE